MSNILRRLRRLETRFTDHTGLVPDSEPWYAYWVVIFDRLMSGENPTYPGNFPLSVADRMIERADREAGIIHEGARQATLPA